MRKKISYFLVVLLAIGFVCGGVLLVYKTNEIRNSLADESTAISSSERIYSISSGIVDSIKSLEKTQLNSAIKEMKGVLEDVDDRQGHLDELKRRVESAQGLKFNQGSDFEVLLGFLGIKNESGKQRKHAQKRLLNHSGQLETYWILIYVLLGIAAVLVIYMSYTAITVMQSREKLAALSNRNRQLFSGSIDAIVVCDLEGRIQEFNKAAESMFSCEKSEVMNHSIQQFYAEEPAYKKVVNELLEKGFFEGEVLNKRKEGELFPSRLSANLIYDKVGAPVGSMGISRDITEEKKREKS